MSGRRDSLAPPEKKDVDPGAHELESESDEHFSDAQSAQSSQHSPIPKTRVEKVDDEPSYGEVPGTEAYRMREGDAEPDEIAIIPDKNKSGASGEGEEKQAGQSGPVPKTVVEQTEDAEGFQAAPEKKHRADPPPDLVVKAGAESGADSPISPNAVKTPRSARSRRKPSLQIAGGTQPDADDEADAEADDDDFGDDFDDFEEGAEGDDDDFGDFDDGFDAPAQAPTPAPPQPPAIQHLSFPIPDYEDLDADDILSLTEPYLNALYPPDDSLPTFPPLSKENSIFLTPRSASLWSQLVAPPPLQPPDWIRSRIRRLFLVSLGVPVDLDEILPASKQKKLVLPSLAVPGRDSPRTSTDSRPANARLRVAGDNASSTSVDTQGKPKEKSSRSRSKGAPRKGPPPPPELDLVAAKQLCTTTDEALDGMTDRELQNHVKRLRELELATGGVLEYWKKRADEKIGDRETFEGVIENLVKHARKVRK